MMYKIQVVWVKRLGENRQIVIKKKKKKLNRAVSNVVRGRRNPVELSPFCALRA